MKSQVKPKQGKNREKSGRLPVEIAGMAMLDATVIPHQVINELMSLISQ